MKHRLSLRRAAVQDIAEGMDFYDAEQAGLGERFRDEVAQLLRRIEANPQLYPRAERTPFRKAVLRVFPYCIYYCVAGEKVVVIAVHDARRDPRRWQERAEGEGPRL
jgi:plasmid stabilization system protein ParE